MCLLSFVPSCSLMILNVGRCCFIASVSRARGKNLTSVPISWIVYDHKLQCLCRTQIWSHWILKYLTGEKTELTLKVFFNTNNWPTILTMKTAQILCKGYPCCKPFLHQLTNYRESFKKAFWAHDSCAGWDSQIV